MTERQKDPLVGAMWGWSMSYQRGERGAADMPGLATASAASSGRRTPEPPAAHQRRLANLSDQPSRPLTNLSKEDASASIPPISGVDGTHEMPMDAASPASSSADAPGSEYDADEYGEALPYYDRQTHVEHRLSALATPNLVPVHHNSVMSNTQLKDEKEAARSLIPPHQDEEDVPTRGQTPTATAALNGDAGLSHPSPNEANEAEGPSMAMNTLLSAFTNDQAPQDFEPTGSLVRAAEENADDDSSKRPRLDDAAPDSEPPANAAGAATATTSKKKAPVKKAAKPRAKKTSPKPKPKKVTRGKGKNSVAQDDISQEAPEATSVQDQTEGAFVAAPDGDRTGDSVVPGTVEEPPEEKPQAKPKRTRKTPARTRKQANTEPQAEAAPHSPTQPLQQLPTGSAPSFAAPIEALLLQEVVATPQEQASAPPEPAAKATRKAPSRAKGKTKVDTADIPSVPPPAAPKKRAPPERAAAKKGKGPVAQLRPAQAEGGISALELDASERSPSLLCLPAPAALMQDKEEEWRDSRVNQVASVQQQENSSTNVQPQHLQCVSAPMHPSSNGGYPLPNVFTPMVPPHYPAQAYWPTRGEIVQQHNQGLNSLTSAASIVESESHLSSAASVAAPGLSSTTAYEGYYGATSPATVTHTAGSVAGDDASETTSVSHPEAYQRWQYDARFYPQNWKAPEFHVMNPETLKTALRDKTVWTFWDCYLPLGSRDQDMVFISNDGAAFPCAAWNPCLFSDVFRQIIKEPHPSVRQILCSGVEENRKNLGFKPLPCVWLDENWRSTNLLLSFVHPIPTLHLPDRDTCELVMMLGQRYGVKKAIKAAGDRLAEIDGEQRLANDKGKGKAREEDIAADLAERCLEGWRN